MSQVVNSGSSLRGICTEVNATVQFAISSRNRIVLWRCVVLW